MISGTGDWPEKIFPAECGWDWPSDCRLKKVCCLKKPHLQEARRCGIFRSHMGLFCSPILLKLKGNLSYRFIILQTSATLRGTSGNDLSGFPVAAGFQLYGCNDWDCQPPEKSKSPSHLSQQFTFLVRCAWEFHRMHHFHPLPGKHCYVKKKCMRKVWTFLGLTETLWPLPRTSQPCSHSLQGHVGSSCPYFKYDLRLKIKYLQDILIRPLAHNLLCAVWWKIRNGSLNCNLHPSSCLRRLRQHSSSAKLPCPTMIM